MRLGVVIFFLRKTVRTHTSHMCTSTSAPLDFPDGDLTPYPWTSSLIWAYPRFGRGVMGDPGQDDFFPQENRPYTHTPHVYLDL